MITKKTFEVKNISHNEWCILSILYVFNIPIWHWNIFDEGFPFYDYSEALREKEYLEKDNDDFYRDLCILIVISLAYGIFT